MASMLKPLSYDPENLDKEMHDFIDMNMNLSVPWYLLASYAYYVEDDPILTDAAFDRLARLMVEKWGELKHEHKEFLSLDMLEAGTYTGEYPKKVKGGLDALRSSFKLGAKYRSRVR